MNLTKPSEQTGDANPVELTADSKKTAVFQAGRFDFPLGKKTYLMGILNITPDSFSDGGRFYSMDDALRHAEELLNQGADILDIGGESTRPGGATVSLEDELERVIPIIDKLSRMLGCPISVDTYKPAVAEAALSVGACIINDVCGLQYDPAMASVAFQKKAGVVIMHNARLYRKNQTGVNPSADIMTDVKRFLTDSCRIANLAGISNEYLMIDPGIGFGVTTEESIRMIAELDKLCSLQLPILLGPSRKRFIGDILDQPVNERLHGTSAAVAVGIARGADFIRVHDVREIHDVIRVADAICRCPGISKAGGING